MVACQSYGNDSDPERFSALPFANLDADEHSSNNGLKNLQPIYATEYPDRLQQIYKSTDKNEAGDVHTHLQALTLNSEDLQCCSQQDDFHSLDLTDNSEEQSSTSEIIIYENHSNTVNLRSVKKDSVSCNENANKEKSLENTPVAVSESDDEDNNEDDASLLPSTHNTDDSAKATMLISSHFTTSGIDKLLHACRFILALLQLWHPDKFLQQL